MILSRQHTKLSFLFYLQAHEKSSTLTGNSFVSLGLFEAERKNSSCTYYGKIIGENGRLSIDGTALW